jgi:hypothetical protein
MPKGYIIITEDVKDPAGFAEYGKLAGKAMAGATLLSFDPKPEVLEGEWHGSQTVVLEFERRATGTTRMPIRRRPSCGRRLRTATASLSPASDAFCLRARWFSRRMVLGAYDRRARRVGP